MTHNEHKDHSHDHSGCGQHHHHHAPDLTGSGRRLIFTILLNLLIPVVQVVGGLLAGSVALISDAMHNFSDFSALIIAYIALRLGQKPPSVKYTFGYRRAEVLAALVNVTVLMGASIFILTEAIHRLRHPEPVSGILVVAVAAVGVVGNGLSALLLHRDAGHNVNLRGAFLHMMADFLTSVVVLISGVLYLFKPWFWVDPLLSLVIVVFILKNCWSLLKEVAKILMEGTPAGLDIEDMQHALQSVEGVRGVHHVHAWNVGSSIAAFTGHVVVEDRKLSELAELTGQLKKLLHTRYGIDHAVIELEAEACGEGALLCPACHADRHV